MTALPILLILICWLISQWARSRYDGMLKENLGVNAPGGASGAEMALEFLKAHEVNDVQVVVHNATVSDYFDPGRRRLFLRKDVAEGSTLGAWAVALHEAAHALQTGEELDALRWRQSCIRMTRYLPVLIMVGVALLMFLLKMRFQPALMMGAGGLAVLQMMNAGTLAVERNANVRLRRWLEEKFSRQPALLDRLESIIGPVATRELGDLTQSGRYFFFSALPGSGSARPK
jgi:uncharacterized protein